MNRIIKSLVVFLLAAIPYAAKCEERVIDMSGRWAFQLDIMDFRRTGSLDFRYQAPLQDSITLPGITDDYKLGMKSTYRHTDRLTREYEYMGPAWYQKTIDIPADWKGKRILLSLERCHWLTTVYIGVKEAGRSDYISVPHRYDLTSLVTPGQSHSLMICVDNRFRYETHKWDHAHTEFTQINWNGILGEMTLSAVDPVNMDDLQIYPDVASKSINVKAGIRNYTGKAVGGKLRFTVTGEGYKLERSFPVEIGADSVTIASNKIDLGADIKLWNEFTPNLYKVECVLEADGNTDGRSAVFGMREVKQGKNQVLINGEPVHLRGTVENAVFPLTGHVPVDDASWERVLGILKSYGMNHMRFHSWCPPAAAFRAADKLGVYFQVELPLWGADATPNNPARFDFFRREQKAILKEYGNHPSFVLYCNGNEISGDFGFVEELTHTGRELDDRHLFSGSTARERVPSDQYYNSHRTSKGSITVYEGNPSTEIDRNKESDIDVPVIAHEAGQRCMYPNFNEIPKYTGPVKPRNFEVFRAMLEANGMGDQANDFFRASGKLTAIEYKDVIETLLRTSTSGGFQLLSINDFPGQGYAFVGILDPMWNSKGLITEQDFRRFCDPVVPLLRFPKRAYFDDEVFSAKAQVYNYGSGRITKPDAKWAVKNDAGKVVARGKFSSKEIARGGVFDIGSLSFKMPKSDGPQKLTVELTVGGKANSWDLWVYPRGGNIMQSEGDVLYATELDDAARKHLEAGGKVVLTPDPAKMGGRKSMFHNHFWNPIMFKWPPMTLGCLIQDKHPVFDNFITDYHTDWQWWDILTNAKVMEMQDMPAGLRPFIQVIDSHDNNKKLGIGFEARVGSGKLLVLALDTTRKMDERPATLQLLRSVDSYVRSAAFAPKVDVKVADVEALLKK